MKSKLDIKYIVKINNGVRFQAKRTDSYKKQKRTDTDRKEPTLIDDTN